MGRAATERNEMTRDEARNYRVGDLSFDLDNGVVRYLCWKDVELLRAISFTVRDTAWATYEQTPGDFEVTLTDDRVRITYSAVINGEEGDFTYHAQLTAQSDGTLVYQTRGSTKGGLLTNRCGLAVLHCIDGIAGQQVNVEHTDGSKAKVLVATSISPHQPVLDIRSLSYTPLPGLTLGLRFEGDAFEMEDQRNWSDASLKTYVRPLSRGYPYRILPGEEVFQRVTIAVTGNSANKATNAEPTIEIGEIVGAMPEIGLALANPIDLPPSARVNYLVARLDLWGASTCLPYRNPTIPFDLDVIVPAREPGAELEKVAQTLQMSGLTPRRLLFLPRRDLRDRSAYDVPNGEADYPEILAVARRVFPDKKLGGGTIVGFSELNRSRPARGVDFVAHSTQAIVHAADDRSVMETLASVPYIVASVRRIVGSLEYRLGPVSIGAPQDFYSGRSQPNPEGKKRPAAEIDPRQSLSFAAAFAMGYAAAAAGIESLTLGATSGSIGVAGKGRLYPLGELAEWLAAVAGRPRRPVVMPTGLAAIAVDGDVQRQLLIANLDARPRRVVAPRVSGAFPSVLDCIGRQSARWQDRRTVVIDGFGVCRLSYR